MWSVPTVVRDDRSLAECVEDLRDRVIVALELRGGGHLTAAKAFAVVMAIECRRARNGVRPDPMAVVQATFASPVPFELRWIVLPTSPPASAARVSRRAIAGWPTAAPPELLVASGGGYIGMLEAGQLYVWDPNAIDWVRMQQPILNAGTVVIPGLIDVADRAGRALGIVSISGVPHVVIDSATLGTVAISAASLPLPAGAAKDSTLTDGSQRIGGTVAVSAAALPLPSGAATETTLEDIDLDVEAINTTLSSTNTKLDTLHADLAAQAKLTDVQPVSLSSAPLPSGAATESSLAQIEADVRPVPFFLIPPALPFFVGGS